MQRIWETIQEDATAWELNHPAWLLPSLNVCFRDFFFSWYINEEEVARQQPYKAGFPLQIWAELKQYFFFKCQWNTVGKWRRFHRDTFSHTKTSQCRRHGCGCSTFGGLFALQRLHSLSSTCQHFCRGVLSPWDPPVWEFSITASVTVAI